MLVYWHTRSYPYAWTPGRTHHSVKKIISECDGLMNWCFLENDRGAYAYFTWNTIRYTYWFDDKQRLGRHSWITRRYSIICYTYRWHQLWVFPCYHLFHLYSHRFRSMIKRINDDEKIRRSGSCSQTSIPMHRRRRRGGRHAPANSGKNSGIFGQNTIVPLYYVYCG